MTLLRVVLSWVASILACTLLRKHVGVDHTETQRTLSPFNLLLKLAGTVLVLWAVIMLHNASKA